MDEPRPSPPAAQPAAVTAAAEGTAVDKTAAERNVKRLEIVKAVGMPLVTLIVTLLGGYYFTGLSKDREARESSERLYAQLLTQREQSDALIRKDMFGVVINRFLSDGKKEDLSNKVLQLELLANNFNQSLDLAPLFKDLSRNLTPGGSPPSPQMADLKKRLDNSAANLLFKQVNSLARRGYVKDFPTPLSHWEEHFGVPFIDERLPLKRLVPAVADDPTRADDTVLFRAEIVDVAVERREVEIRLRVYFSNKIDKDVDRHFWVSPFDFPMLDNTQLPHGLRTSVVISDFFVPDGPPQEREANSSVRFHLVVFPAASASFKERQDYDDVLIDMLRASRSPRLVEASSR